MSFIDNLLGGGYKRKGRRKRHNGYKGSYKGKSGKKRKTYSTADKAFYYSSKSISEPNSNKKYLFNQMGRCYNFLVKAEAKLKSMR